MANIRFDGVSKGSAFISLRPIEIEVKLNVIK